MSDRITNNETARQWLAAKGHEVELVADGAQVRASRVCSRCLGSGRYSFNLTHGSACFGCTVVGKPSRWTELVAVVDYARGLRNAETKSARAAKKAQERAEAADKRERDWCEANGYGRITFAEKNAKLAEQRQAEREANRGVAPEGRVEFTGRVIKVQDHYRGFRGGWELKATIVVTEDDGTEWLAWGTVPGSLANNDDFGKGSTVRLTATLTRGDDAHFAFYKRPANAELVATAAPPD